MGGDQNNGWAHECIPSVAFHLMKLPHLSPQSLLLVTFRSPTLLNRLPVPQSAGRDSFLTHGGIPVLLPLLESPNPRVLARATGALHNVSSSSEAIRVVRKWGGIPKLARLLRHGDGEVNAAAAGAV